MKIKKKIAIIAHDNRKVDLAEWVSFNWRDLSHHSLVCTGTTDKLVEETIKQKCIESDEIPPEIT
jgi:methylglyoxal synthase